MRKGERSVHPGCIRITFHDPVLTQGRGLEERGQVMEEVRRAILSGLAAEEWPVEEQLARRGVVTAGREPLGPPVQ